MSLAKSQPSQRRRTKAAAPPPYPPLPDSGHRLFWLGAYLRDLAEQQTLQALVTEAYRRRRSHLVALALTTAETRAADKVRESAKEACKDGLILFAHQQTTALNGVGGCA